MLNMLSTAVQILELRGHHPSSSSSSSSSNYQIKGHHPSASREHQAVVCALTHFYLTNNYLKQK
jgi:hypothetical protein